MNCPYSFINRNIHKGSVYTGSYKWLVELNTQHRVMICQYQLMFTRNHILCCFIQSCVSSQYVMNEGIFIIRFDVIILSPPFQSSQETNFSKFISRDVLYFIYIILLIFIIPGVKWDVSPHFYYSQEKNFSNVILCIHLRYNSWAKLLALKTHRFNQSVV